MGDKGAEVAAEAIAGLAGLAVSQPDRKFALASRSIHADDQLSAHRAVAPPMHVSTTFRYNRDPDLLVPWENIDPANPNDSHIYSRDSGPNTTRLETVLTSLLNGPTVSYASGLAAFHAMLVRLNPRRIVIGDGYHGCHGIVEMMTRLTGLVVFALPEPEDTAANETVWSRLRPGDVIHVETPVNPTGLARDLSFYKARALEAGAFLTVDSTFAPPPLQDAFVQGADVVMHSGTKYFGGHSDMLCGTLTVAPRLAAGDGDANLFASLKAERLILGSVMGSLEGWLGVRSLRTLELRVRRQSESAVRLAGWLDAEARKEGSPVAAVVEKVAHASLQEVAAQEDGWLRRQMPGGFGPVFALWMKDAEVARRLPSKLSLFFHATSLGGVESLVEWRRMSDKTCDPRIIRVSIGVEAWEDLKEDLLRGFQELAAERK